MNSLFSPEKAWGLWVKYWDKFLLTGLGYTLSLAAIAVVFGTILGALLALMRLSKFYPFAFLGLGKDGRPKSNPPVLERVMRFNPISGLAGIYTGIIRGTPMLLQLYFFYFGLPKLIPILQKQQYACVAIALLCNSAAYVSEIIRSGIQAVDIGQTEAARSLGLSQRQTMAQIVLPQAVKNILPALGNEFIMLVKDTSLASTFFIGDIMTQYLQIKGATYLSIEPLIIVAVIYFVVTWLLSKLLGLIERRMRRGDVR